MPSAGQPARPLPPKVLKKRLGETLRGFRLGLKLSIDAMARKADVSSSSLSRIETGVYLMTRRDFEALLRTYQDLYKADGRDDVLTPELLAELVSLREQAAKQRGWWSRFGVDAPDWLTEYVQLEMSASGIDVFNLIVPGILQTEAYARAVISQSGRESNEVDQLVKMRMARQEHLAESAPDLRVVLDEGALHRRVESNAVMREQVQHLAAIAGRRTVGIHIIPFDSGLVSTSIAGSFAILKYEDAAPSAYVETPDIGLHVEGERVGGFVQRFEKLLGVALGVRESRKRLLAVAETYSS
jgi:transcriptional regulator with XRE-family HTH domain